jgi:hypothetical protein
VALLGGGGKVKITGHKNVVVWMEAKYRQPFPVVKSQITVDGRMADFVISTGEYRIEIDGKTYSGESLIVMAEDR